MATEIVATVRLLGPPAGDAAAVRARIAAAIGKINTAASGTTGATGGGTVIQAAGGVATLVGSAASSYAARNTVRVQAVKAVQKVNQAFAVAVEQVAAETAATVVAGASQARRRGPGQGGGIGSSHFLSPAQRGALTGYQFLEHAVGYGNLRGAGLPGMRQAKNLLMLSNQVSPGLIKLAGAIGGLYVAYKAAKEVRAYLDEEHQRQNTERMAPFVGGRPIEDVVDEEEKSPEKTISEYGGKSQSWLQFAKRHLPFTTSVAEGIAEMGGGGQKTVELAKEGTANQDKIDKARRDFAAYQKKVNDETKEQADHLQAENRMFGKSPRRREIMAAQEDVDEYKRRLARQSEIEPVSAEQKRVLALLENRVELVKNNAYNAPQVGVSAKAAYEETQRRILQYGKEDPNEKAADKQNEAADKQLEAANKNADGPHTRYPIEGNRSFGPHTKYPIEPATLLDSAADAQRDYTSTRGVPDSPQGGRDHTRLPTHRELVIAAQAKAAAAGDSTNYNVPKAAYTPTKGGVGGTTTVPNPEAFQRTGPTRQQTDRQRRDYLLDKQRQMYLSDKDRSELSGLNNNLNQQNAQEEDVKVGGGSRTLGALRRWQTSIIARDQAASDEVKARDSEMFKRRQKMLQPRIDAELGANKPPGNQGGMNSQIPKKLDDAATKLGDAADKINKAKTLTVVE